MLLALTLLLRLRGARRWCVLAATLAAAVPLAAQPRCWSTWLFGEGAGVRFVNDAGQFLDSAEVWPQAPQESIVEGVGIFCDSINGRLLYWTSPRGVQSIRGFGGILPAVTSGVGTSSTQAGIMVPWHTPFFGTNLVYAHLVPDRTSDVSRRDPVVDVDRAAVIDQSTVPPSMPSVHVYTGTYSTERVCAARKPDSSGYLIYSVADDGFLIVRNESVLPNGIPSENRWPLGRSFSTYGQMKVSRSGRMLAIADGQNVVLVDVDPMTGRPGTVRLVPLLSMPALRYGQPDMYAYGCAWATNERFLYLTVRYAVVNDASYAAVVQIDVAAGPPNAVAASSELLDTLRVSESTPPALQLGPDGRIYMPNARYLCVIRNPNRAGNRCSYSPNHIDLSPRRARSGLPSCVESDFPAPDEPYGILRRVYACSADSIVVEVDSLRGRIQSYSVQTISPPSATVTNSRRAVFRNVAAGQVVVRLSLVGVDTIVQRDFTFTVDAVPSLGIGPDTLWLCRGASAGIKARGADSYVFRSLSTFVPVGPDSILFTSVTSPIDVEVLGRAGDCTARRTVAIRILPTTAVISADTAICIGSSAIINVQGASTVRWLDATGADALRAERFVQPDATTTYTAVAMSNSCPDTLFTTVVVHPLPNLDVVENIGACPGDSVLVWARGGHKTTWYERGRVVGLGDSIRILPTAATTLDVEANSEYGCQATAQVRVELRDRYDVRIDVADVHAVPGVETSVVLDVDPEGLGHTYGIIVPRPGIDVATLDNAQVLGVRRGPTVDTIVFRLRTVPPSGRVRVVVRLNVWFGVAQPISIRATLVDADGCANRIGRDGSVTYDVCAARFRSILWQDQLTVRHHGTQVVIEHDPRMDVRLWLVDVLGRVYPCDSTCREGSCVVTVTTPGSWFVVVQANGQRFVVPVIHP